jgi:PAT family beta-lactamase induction signal transducer AmpG
VKWSGVGSRHKKGKALAWVGSTYFAEGLPWSVLHQIAAEYLTAIGMRPAQVGYTSFLHATLSLKFVWSPIVDLFGTLRQWMIGMQALMGVGMGLLAVVAHRIASGPDPASADPSWIWIALITIGVLSATHDIACDGYYMDALDKDDQARFTGARAAAFRAAMLFGSSGLVFLGGRISWLLAFGTAAAIMVGLALAHRLFLPRGKSECAESKPRASEPSRAERWRHVKAAYSSFLRQDRALIVILFLVTYKLADVLMFSMSKVLLDRELGVPTDLRGILNSFSIGASILGAIVGGAWIAKKSLVRTLMWITLLMALTEPLYVLMAALAPHIAVSDPGTAASMADIDMVAATWKVSLIGLVVVVEQFCGGMATAAQMIFIMRRCHPDHKAAHYAFATAVYSTAQMAVGGYSGHVYENVGPVSYFWIVSALTIPAVVLARFVPKG